MIKFKIVVPTYNAAPWIEDCVESIQSQVHKNFDCVIIDDASTDDTWQVLESISWIKTDSRFTVIKNSENKKALYNIVEGFKALDVKSDPESVLLIVDGDDRLYSPYVLSIVNQVYDQTDCLLTWGNHIHYPTGQRSNCQPFPLEIIETRDFRQYHLFVTSHLRTFKSKIWTSIRDEDMRDVQGLFGDVGKYLEAAWDVVIMMPMLEMSAPRIQYIDHILYLYNRFNPLSEDQTRPQYQAGVERYVRSLPKYSRYLS